MKVSQSLLCAGLLLSLSVCHATEQIIEQRTEQTIEKKSYAQYVKHKAGSAFLNMLSAPLEIPKNIINISNESNIVYGFVGGTLQGTLNMLGRLGSGAMNLVTAPIPTKTFVDPNLVWGDFDKNTEYGQVFRLRSSDEYSQEPRLHSSDEPNK